MDGETPTAFRSRFRDDLVPTLKQLQRTQPNAVLRWFYRGQFWESPEAEQEAFQARRRMASARGNDWRPGGQHKDPRAKYQKTRDQKRADFKRRNWGPRPSGPAGPGSPDSGGQRDARSPGAKPWGGSKPYKKSWSGPKGPNRPRGPKSHFGSKGPRRDNRPGGPSRGSRGPRGPRGPNRGGKR